MSSVLERVPYLMDNIQPAQIARLINEVPVNLRYDLAMVVFTVIDGKTRIDCAPDGCP